MYQAPLRLITLTCHSIEYNKKPGKPSVVKVMKDNTVQRDDMYKSGTIHTGQGESPNSVSKPTPRAKQLASKPITSGKLLRPGGPGGGPSKLASRPAPAARPTPQNRPMPSQPAVSQQRPSHQPAASSARPVFQPNALNGMPSSHSTSSSTNRAPPPPPPAAAPPAMASRPPKDLYRAMYDFVGSSEREMSIAKDEVIEIVKKEGNGWWLARRTDGSDREGWAPSAYLKEETQAPAPPPAPRSVPAPPPPPPSGNGSTTNGRPTPPVVGAGRGAKPVPPAPPVKRPAGGAGTRGKPAPPPAPAARDSAVSMGMNGGNSGRGTPDSGKGGGASLAGGLAEALRARQVSMQGKKEDEDDW